MARELAAGDGFSLICGRYEGVDQRVADHLCDGELSVGDFVLAGGEGAALVVIEAVARLRARGHGQRGVGGRGVVHRRPARVPAVHPPGRVPGLGGARGAALRRPRPGRALAAAQALRRTLARRPDLVARPLSAADEALLAEFPEPAPREARIASSPRTRRPASISGRAPPGRTSTGSPLMHRTDLVDRAGLRDDVPDFAPGDTLKVHVRVVEGNRERVQVFQGVVIRRQGGGVRETFSVRKVSFGVGVERTFPVHSPIIAKIEVVTRGDVRRAKLYYLRDRIGKAAKIKEKRF